MANRFFSPDQQFADSTGAALSGAQLFFYTAGTSTKLNTYSDKALSVANTNPVVLDASGRAGSIFLQNLAYKVVLAPSTDTDPPTSPIWTIDNVWTSDFSAVAQFNGNNGNPNGSVAGTQGSAGVPASVIYDFTNKILYVCTTTGNAASAVWTAVNPSAAASAIPAPSGRLTLQSATPVMSADQVAATAVLYTPYTDTTVPIYNGSIFVVTTFSELTLTLVASHSADTLYDVFVFSNSGTPTLVTGPAWSTSTAGSCARGTGAGTTQLSMLNGHLVNTVSMTARNGSSTFSVSANQATYVGTIFTDHTAGQVTCHFSFGQNRKFGVWNAFNRVPITLQVGDSTASWAYNTNTIRASNNVPSGYTATEFNVGSGTTCNGMVILTGLAEETASIVFNQQVTATGASAISAKIGVGLNSTTAFSGINGLSYAAATSTGLGNCSPAQYVLVPSLGINNLVCLETTSTGASATFIGTSSSMLLSANYRG